MPIFVPQKERKYSGGGSKKLTSTEETDYNNSNTKKVPKRRIENFGLSPRKTEDLLLDINEFINS